MNMIPAAKLVFDYVVAAFAPPAPFRNFCSDARSQRLSYRRHLTKTRSNPESRLFRVRYESDICPAIDAHSRFRKNQLQP